MFSKLIWLSALLVLGSFAAPVANNSRATPSREESLGTGLSTCFSGNALVPCSAPVQASKAVVVKRSDDNRLLSTDQFMYLLTPPDIAEELEWWWWKRGEEDFFNYLYWKCFADAELGHRLYLGGTEALATELFLAFNPKSANKPPPYKIVKFQVALPVVFYHDMKVYMYHDANSAKWDSFKNAVSYGREARSIFKVFNKPVISGPVLNVWAFSFQLDAAQQYLKFVSQYLPSSPANQLPSPAPLNNALGLDHMPPPYDSRPRRW